MHYEECQNITPLLMPTYFCHAPPVEVIQGPFQYLPFWPTNTLIPIHLIQFCASHSAGLYSLHSYQNIQGLCCI